MVIDSRTSFEDDDVPITVSFVDGSVTVSNSAPVFTQVLQSQTVNQSQLPVTADYNATDPDGTTDLTFALQDPPAGATIDATTGEFSFTPAGTGTFTIIATVTDNIDVTTTTATITVEAAPVNNAPVFTSVLQNTTVAPGAPINFQYQATDADPGQTANLQFSLQAPPAGATITPQGAFSWTPQGTGTFTVTAAVTDGTDVTTTSAIVTVQATPVNTPPAFTSVLQDQVINVNTALNFQYQATDADPGQTANLQFSLQSPPAGATITPQGAFAWTPQGTGTFTITVAVTDGTDVTTTSATITVQQQTNTPPTFLSVLQSKTVPIGVPVNHDYDANDANGDPLTYAIQTAPAGALINEQTGEFTWNPQGTGAFTITVTVTDGTDVVSTTATITVSNNNQPPVFEDALSNTQMLLGSTLTFDYNATDPELGPSAVAYGLQAEPAGASINATTGVLTFTPVGTGNFNITATATDGENVTTTTATVTVVENNTAPTFTSVLTNQTVNAGVTVSFQFQATDPDPGNALTFGLQQAPAGATITDAGLFTFTPQAAGTFTVVATVTDDIEAVAAPAATITVIQANSTPTFTVVLPDTMITVGTTLNFTYQGTDADGDALAYALASPPSGSSINAQTGVLAFTPATAGTFQIVATVSDGLGSAFTSATVMVKEASANTPPVFTTQLESQSATVGQTITFDFDATDADDDALTFSLLNPPAGAAINAETGEFTFTPAEVGSFEIIATVSDGTATVNAATATITVTVPTGSAPEFTAVLGDQTLVLGRTLTFDFEAADADNDALTFGLSNAPDGATIDVASGVLTFTPTATGTFQVIASVADGQSTVLATAATITVVDNAAPEFTSIPTAPSVEIGATFTFTVEATDANGDALTFSLSTAPEGATIEGATGALAFTPGAAGTFDFTVGVTDGLVTTTADFTLTAAEATSAPVANDDFVSMVEGLASTGRSAPGVLENDTDADTDVEDLVAILVSEPSNGALEFSADGAFTYTPFTDFSGTDAFTYQASDGTNLSNVATVTIEVLPNEDRDGVTDDIEDGVDGNGDGQPDGDGNNDGTPDREQPNVASTPIDGEGDDYVTIAAPEGAVLWAVRVLSDSPTTPDVPNAPTLEEGLAYFVFNMLLPRDSDGNCISTAAVDIIMPDGLAPNRYFKYGTTPDDESMHWYEFANDGTTGTTVSTNAQGRTVLTLNFVDGARGDLLRNEDCEIWDPGAAVFRPTSVNVEDEAEMPNQFALLQNYPNPFNPSTTLAYRLAEPGMVQLEVVNMLGQRVQLLVDEQQAPGRYDVVFDATDLPSGMYLYRLTAGEQVAYKTMLLLK
ncbi:MAG: hypothetical protein RhofKO_08580 [Rhodothermales bacterium]